MKFELLMKAKMLTNNDFSCFQTLRCLLIMIIYVQMPTIVGILTFMSMMIFMFS